MSNTICVKLNGKSEYVPFRWSQSANTVEAFIQNIWTAVIRTEKKNQHGDYIFIVPLNCPK